MQRSEALKKVDLIINGPRAKSHGDATETHTYIAQMWNILLRKKLKEPLDIHDVYRAMIGIKQIRNSQNPRVEDNMIDIIGKTFKRIVETNKNEVLHIHFRAFFDGTEILNGSLYSEQGEGRWITPISETIH